MEDSFRSHHSQVPCGLSLPLNTSLSSHNQTWQLLTLLELGMEGRQPNEQDVIETDSGPDFDRPLRTELIDHAMAIADDVDSSKPGPSNLATQQVCCPRRTN